MAYSGGIETQITTMGSSGVHTAEIIELVPQQTEVVLFKPPLPVTIGNLAVLGDHADQKGLRVDPVPGMPLTDAMVLSHPGGESADGMAHPTTIHSILEAANSAEV